MKLPMHLGSWLGLLILIYSCSKADPVASDYKEKLNQGTAAPVVAGDSKAQTPVTPAVTVGDKKPAGTTDLVAQGTSIWNAKCQGCHGALAVTNKLRSVTNAKDVTDAKATQASHASVAWPAGTEAEAINKVLNP